MSSFSRESTAAEVVDGLDLSGQVFMITGSSSGLGEESARVLAARGAQVAMLARNPQANQEAADRIRSSVPDAELSLHQVDLSELASVESFAAAAAEQFDRIDVLMNNAGVMCCPFAKTADGFEMQFGTNHLGHFALTGRLLSLLQRADAPQAGEQRAGAPQAGEQRAGAPQAGEQRAGAPQAGEQRAGAPRVVTLSSGGHRIADVDLDDPNFEHTAYDPWVSYGRSKSANIHFAAELARRFDGLVSVSVHPGAIPTRLGRHLTEENIEAMRARAKASSPTGQSFQYKSLECGAATQVWAATAAEISRSSGKYLADCSVAEPGSNEIGYAPHIYNPATEAALWELSERLAGVSY